jgi:hypothetical protein
VPDIAASDAQRRFGGYARVQKSDPPGALADQIAINSSITAIKVVADRVVAGAHHRRDDDRQRLGHALSKRAGDEPIGVERQMGPVLLGDGANGHQYDRAGVKPRLRLDPAECFKPDALTHGGLTRSLSVMVARMRAGAHVDLDQRHDSAIDRLLAGILKIDRHPFADD